MFLRHIPQTFRDEKLVYFYFRPTNSWSVRWVSISVGVGPWMMSFCRPPTSLYRACCSSQLVTWYVLPQLPTFLPVSLWDATEGLCERWSATESWMFLMMYMSVFVGMKKKSNSCRSRKDGVSAGPESVERSYYCIIVKTLLQSTL